MIVVQCDWMYYTSLSSRMYDLKVNAKKILSGLNQDALTDLTGDSERLPVEEQHGTWLGHKVSDLLIENVLLNTQILFRLSCDFCFILDVCV